MTELSPENRSLIERVLSPGHYPTGDGVFHTVSYGSTDLNSILNAAREEGPTASARETEAGGPWYQWGTKEGRANHHQEPSGAGEPFRLFDRVQRKGQFGDATGSVMAMQKFDHGWEVWVHVAAYGSNRIERADDLRFISHAPAGQKETP